MRRARPVLLACAALAFRTAAAQCSVDPSTHFTKVLAAPLAVFFPPASAIDFENGFTAQRSYTVEVHPISQDRLRPWYLCFTAEAPLWPTAAGSAKPASDLEWSFDGFSWVPVAQTAQQVTPVFVGRRDIVLLVRARLRYDDLPATYGPLPLRFWAAH